jgi:mycofactocin system glycosyltransferase
VPVGFRVVLDPATRFWSGGRLATGGSPWRVVRFADAALPFLAELRGGHAVAVRDGVARRVARRLLDKGFAHPVRSPRPGPHPVTVVIPAFGRPGSLERCLTAVAGAEAIVVDDGSPDPAPLRRVVAEHEARLIRLPVNRGPAAARNAGLREVATPFVAFVDSDCRPEPGWLDALMPHFDDPRVAAAAPRVLPPPDTASVLARHEAARSALDMGARPALVKPGGRLGFVPTATLVVRVEALDGGAFDEDLRLGEDVDLVWRLIDRGWNVRYEPRARVAHEPRLHFRAWVRRRYEYGTSAAELARRHPGRLSPVRPSAWNLATLCLASRGHALGAAAVTSAAAVLLSRRLRGEPRLVASVVGMGVLADAVAVGHALRREWWPLGAAALAAAPRDRTARAAAAAMLGPIALEWVRHRPAVDPIRYAALRLVEDAAYGSGVLAGAWRARSLAPLTPEIRLPGRHS